jgi:hypothetical protein
MTTRANSKHRQICSKSFSPEADTPHIPLSRVPLECRWRVDPVSGALAARWVDASQRDTGAIAEDSPRYWRRPLAIADAGRRSCCRVAAAGLVLGALAQPALAATIGACQTISQPGTYTLVNNLTAANGNCLVVTGSDITIDLNGFTITGNAGGDAITDAKTQATQRAITVRNGYIVGSRFAVILTSTDGAVVEDMDVSGSLAGITLLRGQVERNHVHNNGNQGGIEGFEAIAAIDNIVLDNQGNGLVAGPGSEIARNVVGRNGNGILAAGNSSGTVSIGDSVLRDNVALRNPGGDIFVNCPSLLQRNVAGTLAPGTSNAGSCVGSPNQPSIQ